MNSPDFCVIGAGICASVIAKNTPTLLWDKARGIGGRLSTKQTPDCMFDFGATMFQNNLNIKHKGNTRGTNLLDYLKINAPHLECLPIFDKVHYFPKTGMNSIPKTLARDAETKHGFQLESVLSKRNGNWILKFQNSDKEISFETKSFLPTLPVPQLLDIFKNSPKNKFLNQWIKFLTPYANYRKTLTSCLYWQTLNPKFENLGFFPDAEIPITTKLVAGSEWEYTSWESLKYKTGDSGSHWLLVQFSESFSETHFDHWMDENKNPSVFAKNLISEHLESEWKLPPPNKIFQHRWKYAQCKSNILGKRGILDLDHPKVTEWLELGKQTGILPFGDFLFGPRTERQILGIDTLFHSGELDFITKS
ncbi:NAD(P)-binding protein [Leptospira sp. 96542]|nr:NAD(P)-binding protein [Leptospira sp. 96542]